MRCDEVLDVAEAFHQAIAGLPRPRFLDTRNDPWTYADRVAWEELPVNAHGVMADLLKQLARARRPVDRPLGAPRRSRVVGHYSSDDLGGL